MTHGYSNSKNIAEDIKMKKVLISVIAVLFAIGTVATAMADLTEGLVGYYKMEADMVSGTDVTDASEAGNNGVFNGAQTLVEGVIGDAYDMTGAYIDLGNITAWQEANQLSLSLWASWHGTGGDYQGMCGMRTSWDGSADVLYWYFEVGNTGDVGLASGPAGWAGTTYAVPTAEWVHYVATFDGTTATLYANGELIGTYGWAFGNDTAAVTVIGAVQGGGANDFNGLMDEVAFWNRALTAEEAAELYNEGQGKELGGNPWKARNPNPASGAIGMSIDGVTLSWEAPDPAFETPGPIAEYDVYFSTNVVPIAEPNGLEGFIGTVAADGALELDILAAELAKDLTYYWRVDTVVDRNDSGGADPNIAIGNLWAFETEKSTPVILTQPQGVLVNMGEAAELTIAIESPSAYTTTWYKLVSGVGVEVGTGDTLTYAAVGTEEAGRYYAVANNVAGDSPQSSIASIVIANMMVAHITCDDDLSAGSTVVDSSAFGRDGVANGDTATVPGIIGNAFSFDGDTNGGPVGPDWIDLGTWNPSDLTGQLSVTFWVKWAGVTGRYQGFVGKRNGWGEGVMMWQIGMDNGDGQVSFQRSGSWVGTGGLILPVDEWAHMAATFDGQTARIFYNGVEIGSGAFSFGSGVDTALVIGDAGPGAQDPFNGAIDDVKLFNYVLAREDIAAMYTDISGATVCMTYNQYDFDQSCVVDLADLMIFVQNGWMNCNIIPDCIP